MRKVESRRKNRQIMQMIVVFIYWSTVFEASAKMEVRSQQRSLYPKWIATISRNEE